MMHILIAMDFSKQSIVSRCFSKKTFGGLDESEVRDCLIVLADEIARLQQIIVMQEGKLKEQQGFIEESRDREHIIKESIAVVQRVTDKIRKDAEEQSEIMLQTARNKKRALLKEAQDSMQAIYDDIAGLKRLYVQFKAGLTASVQAHLDLLKEDGAFSSALLESPDALPALEDEEEETAASTSAEASADASADAGAAAGGLSQASGFSLTGDEGASKEPFFHQAAAFGGGPAVSRPLAGGPHRGGPHRGGPHHGGPHRGGATLDPIQNEAQALIASALSSASANQASSLSPSNKRALRGAAATEEGAPRREPAAKSERPSSSGRAQNPAGAASAEASRAQNRRGAEGIAAKKSPSPSGGGARSAAGKQIKAAAPVSAPAAAESAAFKKEAAAGSLSESLRSLTEDFL